MVSQQTEQLQMQLFTKRQWRLLVGHSEAPVFVCVCVGGWWWKGLSPKDLLLVWRDATG